MFVSTLFFFCFVGRLEAHEPCNAKQPTGVKTSVPVSAMRGHTHNQVGGEELGLPRIGIDCNPPSRSFVYPLAGTGRRHKTHKRMPAVSAARPGMAVAIRGA